MSKPYQTAIYIGRFQPVHKGHLHTIEQALYIAEKLVVVMGSPRPEHRSVLNDPFDFERRRELFPTHIKNDGRITFTHVEDVPDDDEAWARNVLRTVLGDDAWKHILRTCVVSSSKDARHSYWRYFGEADRWFVEARRAHVGDIDANHIRHLWRTERHSEMQDFLHDDTYWKALETPYPEK